MNNDYYSKYLAHKTRLREEFKINPSSNLKQLFNQIMNL